MLSFGSDSIITVHFITDAFNVRVRYKELYNATVQTDFIAGLEEPLFGIWQRKGKKRERKRGRGGEKDREKMKGNSRQRLKDFGPGLCPLFRSCPSL